MSDEYFFAEIPNPSRVDVRDAENSWLATFTKGAYTVSLTGPERTFTEKSASVTHAKWVRTYPAPFTASVDIAWLEAALDANEKLVPDVIAIAMQYIRKAPPLLDGDLQIAGDASYGPLVDGERQENADFNDYLGVNWAYPGESEDVPETNEFRCLDCSGFVRMIWGFRHNLAGYGYIDTVPLSRDPRPDRGAIPRRAFQILEDAPGVLVRPNKGIQVTKFSKLRVGDLVFFDADTEDGPQIDHVGMYLGTDANDRHRFISSRKGANGPTLRDYKGKSVLDGTGLYAKSFRAVHRL